MVWVGLGQILKINYGVCFRTVSNKMKQYSSQFCKRDCITFARFCRCAYFAKFNFGTFMNGPSG